MAAGTGESSAGTAWHYRCNDGGRDADEHTERARERESDDRRALAVADRAERHDFLFPPNPNGLGEHPPVFRSSESPDEGSVETNEMKR